MSSPGRIPPLRPAGVAHLRLPLSSRTLTAHGATSSLISRDSSSNMMNNMTGGTNIPRTINAGDGDRPLCSFDVDGRCHHAPAARMCFECRRFDITGTGYHCEACFIKRHPWTRVAHNFVFIVQRPPTPERAPVVNKLAERTMREARKLLNKTISDTTLLGAPLEAVRPALTAAASTCDALLARIAGTMLQLRSADWQKRQLATRRIVSLWKGRIGRRWWRTSTRLLWGIMRDPESGDDFFINLATLRTSWEKPNVFGRVLQVSQFRRVVPCMLSQMSALSAIQRTARRFFARLKVADLVVDQWRVVQMRAYDMKTIARRKDKLPEGHPLRHFYYYNLKNGRKTRDRPFILFTRVPKKFGEHVADRRIVKGITLLQSYVRKMISKRRVITMLANTWLRVIDPLYKRAFFVNKRTGVSLWEPPLANVLKMKESDIPTAEEYEAILVDREMKMASSVMQRFMLFSKSRKLAAKRLLEVTTWSRVYDEEYKRFFYSDSKTGESSWTKPAIFRRLAVDPPLGTLESVRSLKDSGGGGFT